MSLLSIGLTRYYSNPHEEKVDTHSKGGHGEPFSLLQGEKNYNKISKIIFVFIYIILIAVSASSLPKLDILYSSWNSIGVTNIIQLFAGIMLSFFLPGYSLVTILIRNNNGNHILTILLSYLCSILITSLVVYLSAVYMNSGIYEDKVFLISANVSIVIAFVTYFRLYKFNTRTGITIPDTFCSYFGYSYHKFQIYFERNLSECIVFVSLAILLIVSTYYLYGGITVGDQWYHQNRAILFMYGNFKDSVISSGDQSYTPLLSALLAGLTSISGVPLVNSYSSVAILNMASVFSFFYFCRTWYFLNNKRAALFASTLFVIASGLGWAYMLYLADVHQINSQADIISHFTEEKLRVSDIRLSANFMISAFPDFSTGLTLVSLPAGFLLLALVKSNFNNKISYTIILSLIPFLGILFHDEFYIFILVSSLLPLVFNLQNKFYPYISILIAMGLVYLINDMLPIKYFTSNSVLGLSVLESSIVFTAVTFVSYIVFQRSAKHFHRIVKSYYLFKKHLNIQAAQVAFISKVFLVSAIIYLVALCVIVWIQLPDSYVDAHTQNYNTPWYLYVMRLGISGLIGFAAILSYLFKKFEKEVFVFGIISIIALFVGPYYNEHRMNKYVMVAMIGFASLMIFRTLNIVTEKNPILGSIMIGSIVTIACLSTLMYIGYNALVVETGDYTHALGRRNFPSLDEISVLDSIRSKIQRDSEHGNVASFPNQYNYRNGNIISKLHAFSGLPLKNSIQTQYLLNSSTLDSFYHLLELSKTGYIMVPTNTLNQTTLTSPTRFVMNNFQKIYEDRENAVINIPRINGPSTNSESIFGIVHKRDQSMSSLIFDEQTLYMDNKTFNIEKGTPKFVDVKTSAQQLITTLYGNKKDSDHTIWSKDLKDRAFNFIEFRLRIVDETKSGKSVSGIKWIDGNVTYFVSLSNKGLQLREQKSHDGDDIVLSRNSQATTEIGTWHELSVEVSDNAINVYLDKFLKIKVARNHHQNSSGLVKLGVKSENNILEFEPIKIGKFAASQKDYDFNDYSYYYPLTSLALSGIKYDSYLEGDNSVFSNPVVILPFDETNMNKQLVDGVLNYSKSGGTLIVINPHEKFNGTIGKIFQGLRIGNATQKFFQISSENKGHFNLNVSGTAKNIQLTPLSNLSVIASYRNISNESVAPFAIEKRMSEKGRLIYINGFGYFNSIFNDPKQYFSSLSKFIDLLESNQEASPSSNDTNEPIRRFIGDESIAGEISLNGSSFTFVNESSFPGFYVQSIAIYDAGGNLLDNLRNLTVSHIQASGEYEYLINFTGKLTLPSGYSYGNYLGVLLPERFDITIKTLGNKGQVEIVKDKSNSTIVKLIAASNESRIELYGVREQQSRPIPLLLKNPTISVNGSMKFDKTNFYGQEIDDYFPIFRTGQMNSKFAFVEDFKESSGEGTKIGQLSYLDSVDIEGKINQPRHHFEFPGQISVDVNKRGMGIPYTNILTSSLNYYVIITIAASTVGVLLARKIKVI